MRMICKLNEITKNNRTMDFCDCYECQWRNAADMDIFSVDRFDDQSKSNQQRQPSLKTLRHPPFDEVRFFQPEQDLVGDLPAFTRYSVSEVIKHRVSFKVKEQDPPCKIKVEETFHPKIFVQAKAQELENAVTAANTPPLTDTKHSTEHELLESIPDFELPNDSSDEEYEARTVKRRRLQKVFKDKAIEGRFKCKFCFMSFETSV
jgi:hypothetical protein